MLSIDAIYNKLPSLICRVAMLLVSCAGPGCSSFGIGAFQEIGPFRVDTDGKTLCKNKYTWNSGN